MTAPASGRMSPLDYMLSVINDPGVDDARRDRMAIAAAPYVHARVADGEAREERGSRAGGQDRRARHQLG